MNLKTLTFSIWMLPMLTIFDCYPYYLYNQVNCNPIISNLLLPLDPTYLLYWLQQNFLSSKIKYLSELLSKFHPNLKTISFTGLSFLDCGLSLWQVCLVSQKHEWKSWFIFYPCGKSPKEYIAPCKERTLPLIVVRMY